jgi:hypothetical protein
VSTATPAATPAGRRDQVARELTNRAAERRTPLSMPRAAADNLGLSRTERRQAQWRALARLARANREQYLRLLAEESAAVAGGRG